jgi:cobyrinic acid a,c-diamide synthase
MKQAPGPAGFIIAGTHSGVGKTTASFAVMARLAERGFTVQPFKIGPDFIDPGYHRLATGRPSVNLDLWMMGADRVQDNLERYGRTADVVVLEGMGALYDGENGDSERGSAAWFARHLDLPVLLVLDIWGMTRSTAAVIRGFEEFDPRVRIGGFLLNRAGSLRHFEMVRDALPEDVRRRVVGYLPADDGLTISERHLGLVTLEENPNASGLREKILERTEETFDVDRLIQIFGIRRRPMGQAEESEAPPQARIRLGLARDRAFSFYYLENLRLLEEAGAELVPFSPLEDEKLPEALSGLYIGGGYPESFPEALSANQEIQQQIRDLAAQGAPVYAECGGLMYLGAGLTGFDGQRYPMVSLLPLEVAMDRSHLAIRYVEIETLRPSILGPAGTRARGQEFHQSRLLSPEIPGDLYRVVDSRGEASAEGFGTKNVLGSYIHLHFGSNPDIPRNLVAAACRHAASRKKREDS